MEDAPEAELERPFMVCCMVGVADFKGVPTALCFLSAKYAESSSPFLYSSRLCNVVAPPAPFVAVSSSAPPTFLAEPLCNTCCGS